jgi:hypothetical protein
MRRSIAGALAMIAATQGPLALAQTADAPTPVAAAAPTGGWSFNPDSGWVYRAGDFKLTTWGFAERLFDPDGPDSFRRFRQGAEFDFPRITERLRPALVYEVDLTNTGFFDNGFGGGQGVGRRNLENLFVSVQEVNDPGRFRVLVGENTHILSRDDNLSSGNLPTINRSLILEEHGSVNSFGAQFGVQFQTAVASGITLQLAAMDNRGSFNAADPRYQIGNSLSGKLLLTPFDDPDRGRLTLGLAVDHTGDIRDRAFTLATAISQTPLGAVPATGDKTTWEADAAWMFRLFDRPATLEAEAMRSHFSESRSDVVGGYAMAQWSLFDAPDVDDLDVFIRYDLVSLGQDDIATRAEQRAVRTGLNYNLPHTNKLLSLHVEQAHNTVTGSATIVTGDRTGDEFRIGLRASFQRYSRH